MCALCQQNRLNLQSKDAQLMQPLAVQFRSSMLLELHPEHKMYATDLQLKQHVPSTSPKLQRLL